MMNKSPLRNRFSIGLLIVAGIVAVGCAPATPTSAPPEPTTSMPPTEAPPAPTATTAPPAAKQITPCQPDPNLSGESPYPAPTGPYQVGVTAFQLVDPARPEILTGAQSNFRTVNIYVWYPAEDQDNTAPCSYTSTFSREHSRFDGYVNFYGIDPDAAYQRITEFSLYAVPDAAISDLQETYEVVVFSNWEAGIPVNQSSQLQELASHGYIVVDVIHTYGTSELIGDRGAIDDLIFVIDQLAGLNADEPENQLSGHFNLDQIGMAGSYSGGVAALYATSLDSRIKAAVTLDGGEPPNGVDSPLSQPMMVMAKRGGRVYKAATGAAYMVNVNGFESSSYTDLSLWVSGDSEGLALGLWGSTNGLRAIQIVNTYMLAFFDKYLRGIDTPLLDGPSPDYPEVSLESRNTD
jgi:hypothetical protein